MDNIRVYGVYKVEPLGTTWEQLDPIANVDHLGFTIGWLNPANPEPARVQLDTNYRHGGGFHPFTGFTLHDDYSISYPGDPSYKPLWRCQFREDEHILVYPHAWFMVLNPATKEFVIARMD